MHNYLLLAVLLLPIATHGQSTDHVKLCSEPNFGGTCVTFPVPYAVDTSSWILMTMTLGSFEITEGQAIALQPGKPSDSSMLNYLGPIVERDVHTSLTEIWSGLPKNEPVSISLHLSHSAKP